MLNYILSVHGRLHESSKNTFINTLQISRYKPLPRSFDNLQIQNTFVFWKKVLHVETCQWSRPHVVPNNAYSERTYRTCNV